MISTGTHRYTWIGFCIAWDYHNIMASINILSKELMIEVIHHRWHKKRWNKNCIAWSIDKTLKKW